MATADVQRRTTTTTTTTTLTSKATNTKTTMTTTVIPPSTASASAASGVPSSAEQQQQQENDAILSCNSEDDVDDTLLCLNFNQDGGCLAVGTAHGFRICNTVPFQETFRRTFVHSKSNSNNGQSNGNGQDNNNNSNGNDADNSLTSQNQTQNHEAKSPYLASTGGGGGIGSIEMLFRCNLLALVGGGNSPQYQKNKVLIWDDHLGRPIGELSFRHRVLAVKLRRDRICVALRDRVYVYNFGNLALLDTIVTGQNHLGLLCISTDAGSTSSSSSSSPSSPSSPQNSSSKNHRGDDCGMVLACPSVTTGQARVELYGKRKTLLIDAHESALAAMALTVDGTYLATASERGTIVRLFSTVDKGSGYHAGAGAGGGMENGNKTNSNNTPIGVPLREFRRGVEQARIGSLSFSLDRCWLACASDRGTVHVFRVEDEDQMEMANNRNGHTYGSSTSGHYGAGRGNNTASTRKSKSHSSFPSSLAKKILPSMLTKSPRKYLLEGENSYVQVRGITHPKTCAFVPDRPHTIAVAGLDDFGNGCLLLAGFGPAGGSVGGGDGRNDSFFNSNGVGAVNSMSNSGKRSYNGHATKGEARRLSYHRFFKKGTSSSGRNHNRGDMAAGGDMNGQQLKFSSVNKEEEYLSNQVEEITFGDDADGFVSITADQQESPNQPNSQNDDADDVDNHSATDNDNGTCSGSNRRDGEMKKGTKKKKSSDASTHINKSDTAKEKRRTKPTSQ